MKIIINFILLIVIIVSLDSCKLVDNPTGFISARDVTPPRINIIEPFIQKTVKDSLVVHFTAFDFSGISSVNVKIDGYLAAGVLTHTKNNYTINLDISFLKDTLNLSITAFDRDNNSSTKFLTFIANPIVQVLNFPGVKNYELAELVNRNETNILFN